MRALAYLCGFFVGFASLAFSDPHQHGGHGHGMVEITNYEKPPSISLEVFSDAKSGYNLHVKTRNFRFAPELINTSNLEGQGHVHLYINGEKRRVYGPWVHLAKIPQGEVALQADLCANTHDVYTVHGKPVRDRVIITADGKVVRP